MRWDGRSACRLLTMIRRNVPGIAATDLTPDLAGFDLVGFLGGLQPGRDIAVRHTVGLVDPIVAADQAAGRTRR